MAYAQAASLLKAASFRVGVRGSNRTAFGPGDPALARYPNFRGAIPRRQSAALFG
jgi:hypothetical protein